MSRFSVRHRPAGCAPASRLRSLLATKTVLELLGDRLVTGSAPLLTSISTTQAGWVANMRPGDNYVDRADLNFQYEGYAYDHEQMIVVGTGRSDNACASQKLP